MGSLNGEGKLYFHVITFVFLFIMVAALKNADFNDLTASDDLTRGQTETIALALWAGALLSLIFLVVRGWMVRDKSFGGAGTLGLILVFIGVWVIGATLGLDGLQLEKTTIDADGMISMVIASALPIIGTYMVTSVMYSTTRQDEAIVKAVREEIERTVASNNVVCPGCRNVISAYSTRCKYCLMDFSEPEEEEEEEDVLITVSGPVKPAPAPRPAPPTSAGKGAPSKGGEGIFTCSSCNKKLKVSNPKRPIKIRCPGCKNEETLWE